MLYQYLCALAFLLLTTQGWGQDSSLRLPQGYVGAVEKKATSLTQKLDQKTQAYLTKFQQREAKLLRKLAKKDSTKAKELLAASQAKYTQLQQQLNGKAALQEYLPSLDTLTTSLKFIAEHKERLATTVEEAKALSEAVDKVEGLQSSLGKTEIVSRFLQERKASLSSSLQGLPFGKDLQRLHKQAYYYKAQVAEYKALLKDHQKLERKALELLSKTKVFQDFMRKNSQLASLFRLPGGEGESSASLQGLQTRAQVNSLLQERFGNDPSTIAQLKENVQAAQGQLNSLKSKAESLQTGSVGNTTSDIAQPNFRRNSQKTRSFLKRIELGTNIQTQKAQWLFPITSDLGLSLGYKLNDKSSIGVGGSYKLGLGTGWQQIRVTHQGVGLRSFIDYQLKGSFFLSGGYEQQYRSAFKAIEQLKDQSAWQSSGLLGLTKKYQVSKKLKGNMQLLWDFLSYRQRPTSTPLLFRIGYSLK